MIADSLAFFLRSRPAWRRRLLPRDVFLKRLLSEFIRRAGGHGFILGTTSNLFDRVRGTAVGRRRLFLPALWVGHGGSSPG
jgi:hypothetical protein